MLVTASSTGCVESLGEERSRIGTLVRDCVVPRPPGITRLGAPTSLEWPGESLWIWESFELDDGTLSSNAFARVRSADDACSGRLDVVRAADGAPARLLALSADEQLAEESRTDGRHLALVPAGGWVHDGRGHLYYELRENGPGFFDSRVLGTGLCIVEGASSTSCERVTRDGDPILWEAHARPLNRGGFVDADGFAVVYGCAHAAAFEEACTVARVDPSEAAEPSAYRFHHPFDGWIDDPANAGIVARHFGQLRVAPNAHLGGIAAIGIDAWSSSAVVYRADGPTDELRNAEWLFDAVAPATFFLEGGVYHPSLDPTGSGRTIDLSYATNAEGPNDGLHLATYRFDGGGR